MMVDCIGWVGDDVTNDDVTAANRSIALRLMQWISGLRRNRWILIGWLDYANEVRQVVLFWSAVASLLITNVYWTMQISLVDGLVWLWIFDLSRCLNSLCLLIWLELTTLTGRLFSIVLWLFCGCFAIVEDSLGIFPDFFKILLGFWASLSFNSTSSSRGSFRAVSEQLRGSSRAISEQFQSSFRAI